MSRKSTVFKRCQSCGQEKSLSDFYRNRTKPDGHNGICADCQGRANRASRERRTTEARGAAAP